MSNTRSTKTATAMAAVAAIVAVAVPSTAAASTGTPADEIAQFVTELAPDEGSTVAIAEDAGTLHAAATDATMTFPSSTDGAVTVKDTTAPDLRFTAEGLGISQEFESTLQRTSLSLTLPGEVDTVPAQTTSSGDLVYTKVDSQTDVVVQALASGEVRIQTVSNSAESSTTFTYTVEDGIVPVILDDGSVSLTVPTDDPNLTLEVGALAVPWAFDANGVAIATHYEVDGRDVVQHVDHTSPGVTYPVVADPVVSVGIGVYWHFNRAETKTWAGYGVAGMGAAGGACGAVGSLGGPIVGVFSGAVCATVAAKLIHAAGVAENSSPKQCFYARMITPTVVGFTAGTYKDSRCK